MKKKNVLSVLLSAAMLMSAVPAMNVSADDNDVVYSYTDSDGEVVNLTQDDLDNGYWNKDALGKASPEIYADFPAGISNYVDEFTNMTIYVDYMKALTGGNSAVLEISDALTDEVLFSDDLTDGYAQFEDVHLDTVYKFTITEDIDGSVNEYYKAVTTAWSVVDMPEEIINGTTESESIILVGDIKDLRASIRTDESGNEYVDTSMPRYNQVKECDFSSYISQLDHDNIYRVYMGNGGTSGFIIDDSGNVKSPDIDVTTWDAYISSSLTPIEAHMGEAAELMNAPQYNVNWSMIMQATDKINLYGYRDACFKHNDSNDDSSRLMVATYTVPADYYDEEDAIIFTMTSNRSITWQIWVSTLTDENYYSNYNNNTHIYSSYNNPIQLKTAATNSNGNFSFTFLRNAYKNKMSQKPLREGDKLYFVAYFPENTGGMAYMTCRSQYYPLDTDETISSNLMSEAYNSSNSVSSLAETNFTLKNMDDVDAYYIDNEGASRTYTLYVTNYTNTKNTSHIKDVQLVRVRTKSGYVYTELNDVVTVPQVSYSGSPVTRGFTFTTSSSYHYGVYIYTPYRGDFSNDTYKLSFSYN